MDDSFIIDYYRDDVSDLNSICILEDGIEISFYEYIDYLLKRFPYKTKIIGYDKVFDGKENLLTVEDIKKLIKLGLLKDDLNLVNSGN